MQALEAAQTEVIIDKARVLAYDITCQGPDAYLSEGLSVEEINLLIGGEPMAFVKDEGEEPLMVVVNGLFYVTGSPRGAAENRWWRVEEVPNDGSDDGLAWHLVPTEDVPLGMLAAGPGVTNMADDEAERFAYTTGEGFNLIRLWVEHRMDMPDTADEGSSFVAGEGEYFRSGADGDFQVVSAATPSGLGLKKVEKIPASYLKIT